ncbi:SurA N-terminal domain-containing protein [Microbulbifer thermotolerans]|uniref:Periplasmic chaperone PpiD n=1 Tax=Microbulbifer thermotolerans TaxID=252514 RepID=A0AB35HVH4_MICTH|nr:SurA N-terminal domain-containing protein [Microbulbifer thermotolerans]MCX2801391.1 SurA N-terminal domain-containing protein [Microbulbifer thermotolerans]MCX2833940.1 SurA N-terminal domain-containing protein [Microbulbifer thermotolerans]
MLQSMRDNLKGTAAIIVAGFFGFIMVIGGIDFFTGASGGAADAVAEVNGEKITNLDLQRAIQNRRNMIMSQYGENVPADLLSDEQLREPVLRQLVSSSVMRQAAQDSGMVMSAAAIDREIVQIPGFQVGGKFDAQVYRDALRRMGYSAVGFRQVMERDLVMQQYIDGITNSAFTTRADAERVVAVSMEERDFDYVILPVQQLLDETTVSDSEVEEYYQDNQDRFQRPEQVAIEYIELTPELFADSIDVSEQDVRAQYEQELASFQAKTRRRAAHILLEGDNVGKVAEVQAKLNAGEDFAELAKSYSDDLGSRDEGGDLGFTSGDVFPESFEEALASLEVGQVSGPVTTDSGTHFIKLLEVENAEPPSYEERKDAIAAQLRSAEAEREFVGALERLADLAYNADTLAGPAEELGVPLQTSELFSRQGGAGIAANDKVVAAAFAPEVKEDGNTSDVINLTDNHSVVLRVVEHKTAGIYPLEEVKPQIVERLKREKASEQLATRAKELKAQLEEGGDFAELAEASELTLETSDKTRRGGFGQRGEIIAKAFELPAPDSRGERITTFAVSDGDQVVLKLRSVNPGQLSRQSSEQRRALIQQLASISGGAELAAVQRYLSDEADIEFAEQ